MTIVVPDTGESDGLTFFVSKANPTALILKLYTSNTTPGETDTAGTYTECSVSGYTALTLTGANWTISGTAPTTATYAQQTFTFTGNVGNIYGYFVTRVTSGNIAYAERFSDGPYNVTTNGDQIKITPTITLD